MATVVNTRDLIIQATLPRVATVDMAPNIVVSPDQVDGLGLIVAGTKMVFLEGTTQVFQVAKDGDVSPTSTVLVAKIQNLSASPTLSVVDGTISPAPVLQPDKTCTILESQLVTDTATLRLSVTQDSVTYTDEFTIARVREGADSINGLLTNESSTLPADYLGNILNYGNATGNFKVYLGATDVTNLCQFAVDVGGNPQGLTTSINAATGAYSVTGGYPTNVDSATVRYKATFGTNVILKVFTVTKSKNGQNGTNGSNGTNGKRGSMTFYVALTGSTAVWSDSLATTTASAQGGEVILNDTVTQYNNSQNFSETRFWNGSAWVIVNAVVDGNLLVSGTVGAAKMTANLMQSDNVLTRGLTVRDNSGNVILSSGQGLSSTYILDAAITSAKIANTIQSSNWASGSAGWQINKTGYAEFNNITVRGTVTSSTVSASNLIGGAYTGYAWPAPGGTGFCLNSNGLLLGNANDGKYFQVTAAGNIYAPQFSIENGSANFYGALQAASGSFSGVLTASAVNAVNTINIAGQAVTIPVSAYIAGQTNYNPLNGTQTDISVGITSSGAPIQILGCYFAFTPTGNGGVDVWLYRDGTVIWSGGVPVGEGGQVVYMLSDVPGPGFHTYAILMRSSNNNWSTSQRSLLLLETKR